MTVTTFSAQDVVDRAPLGAIIQFSDGTPRPPSRFKRKLRAWTDRNGTGRLTEKRDPNKDRPGDFTLHLGNWGSNEVIVLSVNRLYTTHSPGYFIVESVPQPGEALVLTEFMGRVELRQIASDKAAAQAWLEAHRYAHARIEVVATSATSPVAD